MYSLKSCSYFGIQPAAAAATTLSDDNREDDDAAGGAPGARLSMTWRDAAQRRYTCGIYLHTPCGSAEQISDDWTALAFHSPNDPSSVVAGRRTAQLWRSLRASTIPENGIIITVEGSGASRSRISYLADMAYRRNQAF